MIVRGFRMLGSRIVEIAEETCSSHDMLVIFCAKSVFARASKVAISVLTYKVEYFS